MLQVTPNGPWGKDVHPAMPVTTDELLADLEQCFAAGADGVHLHVRDGSGAETLDPVVVNDTVRRIRELDERVEIGLTTGAWIVPDLAERLAMIAEWEGVDCATVNLSEDGYEQVMATMLEHGIGVDVGLWSPDELDGFLATGLLDRVQRVSIELDDGEPYFLRGEPEAIAQRVNDALDAAGATCPRLTHGMTAWTWPLVRDAFRRGHDTRVGFEDSVLLPDGTTASNNAQLVRAAIAVKDGRPARPRPPEEPGRDPGR